MNNEKGTGSRENKGKIRYDLFEPFATEQLALVFSKGANKYEDRNWEKGMKWSKMEASLMRHFEAYKKGLDFDTDQNCENCQKGICVNHTGLYHIAQVAWNAMGILSYYKLYPQGDDRRHDYLYPKKIGLDVDGVLADFTGHLLTKLGYPKHIPVHWNDPIIRNGFELYKHDKQFWLDIPPLVTREDINFEPHAYITARSIDEEVTKAWLDKYHLPTAKIFSIGIGESKVEVAKKSGVEIFVDDNFDNFIQLTNAGIFTYLYNAPYNEKYEVGFRRIHHLNEIL